MKTRDISPEVMASLRANGFLLSNSADGLTIESEHSPERMETRFRVHKVVGEFTIPDHDMTPQTTLVEKLSKLTTP